MDKKHERMRWACRRGMLELDLFLVPYFDHCFETLTEQQKHVFSKLLEETDPCLLSWLMNHDTPLDEELAAIVNSIRQFRLSRPPYSTV